MEPVLILKNDERIAFEKAALTTTVALFQSVYNAIKASGVTPTLQEISALVTWTTGNNGMPNFEYDYIINKLLDAAAPYSLNGVSLQKSKVKEMITPPNVTGLKTALAAARLIQAGVTGHDLALMFLNADVISKVANSNTVIETRHTHYTKSDASAAMANDLQAVCDALNAFDGVHDKQIAKNLNKGIKEFSYHYGKALKNPLEYALLGIELNGEFKIKLSYIRAFEAGQPA